MGLLLHQIKLLEKLLQYEAVHKAKKRSELGWMDDDGIFEELIFLCICFDTQVVPLSYYSISFFIKKIYVLHIK